MGRWGNYVRNENECRYCLYRLQSHSKIIKQAIHLANYADCQYANEMRRRITARENRRIGKIAKWPNGQMGVGLESVLLGIQKQRNELDTIHTISIPYTTSEHDQKYSE